MSKRQEQSQSPAQCKGGAPGVAPWLDLCLPYPHSGPLPRRAPSANKVLSKLESLIEITDGGHLRAKVYGGTHATYRGGKQSSCPRHSHCPLNCVHPCKPELRLDRQPKGQEGAYARKS